MYSCPNCNAPVAFGVRFCTNCGTPLNWPSQPQMQRPPAYQQQPQQWQHGYGEQRPERKKTSPWLIGFLGLLGVMVLFAALVYVFDTGPALDVKYFVTSLPESRETEIVIEVLDENNTPVGNAEVYYEQISQDFMYNVGEDWDPGAREAGTNTMGIYLDWEWGKLEPEDDIYDWSYLEDTGVLDKQGRLKSDTEHVYLRLGVVATSAWIAGSGMDSFQDTGYPPWIDKDNLEQVKAKYLEFVAALLNHLKFEPDFYMIEVEINALGSHAGLTNQEIIDWLEQLTTKIKELDENARVSITIAALDLEPFMEEYRTSNDILVEQGHVPPDMYPLPVTDFLEKMNHVDYDIITLLIQPFGWFSKGDWEDGKDFTESLSSFDKEIYIGWVAFLAEEPIVPAELNPNPNGSGEEGGFIYYPNPEGHSEEWQREQTVNFMSYIISNHQIIGVHWDMLDFVEPDVGGEAPIRVTMASGFTSGYRNENNEVIKGAKRLVYQPMKELWQSLFSQGSLQTDDAGTVKFTGFPGEYRIEVSHSDYRTKKIIINAQ